MKALNLDLESCYGIKKLSATFDFSTERVVALYAPNGSMKSSLAQAFKDEAEGKPSVDRIFHTRKCKRSITTEAGAVSPASILVIRPYEEEFGDNQKTSTLLVDATLRKEYEKLHLEVDESKKVFLLALKEQSKSKKDLEAEISSTFTKTDAEFFKALLRIKEELQLQNDAPFADVPYDTIFDEKVLSFLGTKDFKLAIEQYITKYNELIAASTYFRKGTFTYYNAETIAKSLAENGFFAAKHSVSLNADTPLNITTQKELEDVIRKEKESITNDKVLKKKFDEIEKLLTKNAQVRAFWNYISENSGLLPKLANIDAFKEELWKSYIKKRQVLYDDLISKYLAVEARKRQIEEAAAKQRTQWEEVIEIFNERYPLLWQDHRVLRIERG